MPRFSQLFWPAMSSAIATLFILGITHRNEPEANREPPQRDTTRIDLPTTNRQLVVKSADSAVIRITSNAVAQHPAATQNTVNQPVQNEQHPSSEAERLRMEQDMMTAHEERISIHDRETRDFNWASQMENRIQDAFHSLPANAKAHLERTDCRSQTCTVVISWPSREDAQQELQLPSVTVAQIPCNDGIVLPLSTAGEGRFEATMLLDCVSRQVASRN